MTASPARRLTRRQWLATSLGAGLVLPAWSADAPAPKSEGFQISDWPRQRPVPALDALSLQSDPVRLSDFRGKVLVLNFWATWCPPCRAELPTLQALPEWFGEDKVAVLALNFQEAGRTVRRFLETSGLKLPVALDANGDVTRAWGVRAFPTTVLIDRQGKPRQIVQGEVDWASATALGWVERVLALR
ncbi:TlpA family protein disulfide reductase [Hydrogenophaga sp. MI9]|uniref:TlpA family protein disulfide reductase n=1 Tax=Hydrogenophaga sp. MI9 TaxID=3453719 RepID=UPI003EEC1968